MLVPFGQANSPMHQEKPIKNESMKIWVFPKIGVPQIIHIKRGFHYKPSILGYPYFWKHPYGHVVGCSEGLAWCLPEVQVVGPKITSYFSREVNNSTSRGEKHITSENHLYSAKNSSGAPCHSIYNDGLRAHLA